MYLNVNLTVPPSEGGATPKTPEIVNSLISLTPTPRFSNHCQKQATGDLLSPSSTASTPGEEVCSPLTSLQEKHIRSGKRHCSGSSSDGGSFTSDGSSVILGGSPTTSFSGGPLVGATPPATPDLPSPVNTLQATKSALIKEGLKHQIRSKLHAAGVGPDDLLLESKMVKEELTNEDADRRKRRRERNKIAATKCRNKKKEKTTILLSESDEVEDQNVRLKSEIQRLRNEKLSLEKLLRDPNHRATCRHNLSGAGSESGESKLPLISLTSYDEAVTTTANSHPESCVKSSACSPSFYSSSNSQVTCSNMPVCNSSGSCSQPSSSSFSTSQSTSCETSLSSPNKCPLPSNISPSTPISMPSNCIPGSPMHMNSENLDSKTLQYKNINHSNKQQIQNVCQTPQYSPIKASNHSTRYHPYENNIPQSINYNLNSQMESQSQKQFGSMSDNQDFSYYDYPKVEPMDPNYCEFTPPNPPGKNNFIAPKSRAALAARYHPYNASTRQQLPGPHNANMRPMGPADSFDPSGACVSQRIDFNTSDQTQFYSYL